MRRPRPQCTSRRGSAGAVQDAGDGIGVGDDLGDTHAAATFSAAGDAQREDAGEELCPADTSWSGRGRGRRFGRVEVQRELWRRCGGPGDDVLAQAMVAGLASLSWPKSAARPQMDGLHCSQAGQIMDEINNKLAADSWFAEAMLPATSGRWAALVGLALGLALGCGGDMATSSSGAGAAARPRPEGWPAPRPAPRACATLGVTRPTEHSAFPVASICGSSATH